MDDLTVLVYPHGKRGRINFQRNLTYQCGCWLCEERIDLSGNDKENGQNSYDDRHSTKGDQTARQPVHQQSPAELRLAMSERGTRDDRLPHL